MKQTTHPDRRAKEMELYLVHNYEGSITSCGFLSTDEMQQGSSPASYFVAVNGVILKFLQREKIRRADITLKEKSPSYLNVSLTLKTQHGIVKEWTQRPVDTITSLETHSYKYSPLLCDK